jgi:hypothetical protein
MTQIIDPGLAEQATFRANPAYELVLFDRLPAEQQQLLGKLKEDPDSYGILRPAAGSGLVAKSVRQDAALLFLTLREPGRLPAYVRARFGADSGRAVAELVLDGILEIEAEGQFRSGAEALRMVMVGSPALGVGGRVAQLSRDALQYAQALALPDARFLALRLYCYNQMPLTPRWQRQWPTAAAVEEHLGIGLGGRNRAHLDRSWSRLPASPASDGWLEWRARRERRNGGMGKAAYKLYLSPACDAVAEAFDALMGASAQLPALAFKVGKGATGLLRPDKMVLYFDDRESLAESADRLHRALDGCPAHGVPFTAESDPDGLLSWGTDPPLAARDPLSGEGESWRMWLAQRLARWLVAGQTGGAPEVEPWQFALERLRLEGVDPETWTPSVTIWKRYLDGEE